MYLRGRFLFEQHNALDAVSSFERAIEIDPSFALAHAWAGLTVVLAANLGAVPPSIAYPRGKVSVDRALSLDPHLAEAHLLGAIHALWYDRDYATAERRAREAASIAPSMPHSREFIAWSLLVQGKFNEAVTYMEQAHALDPLSDFMLINLALVYVLTGLTDRAIDALRPGLARSPGNGGLQWTLGLAMFGSDRLIEARSAFERARELVSIGNRVPAALSCAMAALGEMDNAQRMLDEARELAERGKGSATEVAMAYHWIGDDATAFVWFERAIAAHEMWLTFLALDPRLKRLRSSPSFQQLLRRID